MTDSLYQRLGGLVLPFEASDVSDTDLTGEPLDPARDKLLALFEAALQEEYDAAWTKVCAALPDDHELYGSTSIVGDTLPDRLTPEIMLARKPDWPLLSLHRFGEVNWEERTTDLLEMRQHWLLSWVHGCGTVGDSRKLGDFNQAVAKTVAMTIDMRGHPAYESGAIQWANSTLDGPHPLGSVRLMRHNTDPIPIEGHPGHTWNGAAMILETTEMQGFELDAFGTAQGAFFHVHAGDEAELIQDFVQADTDYPGTMHED